ncbi:30126_t:CDS:2 [Gigaspora margarita]|uniref:30126_t:CDS:1 n=1 Tax=Gigaspora margarita TaxID=4874 RepID=A0ABN7UQ19_GIGMA|nr:30126_t:CDS:2 [Gigaspora margarita]
MSLPISQISIIDLDENNIYNNLLEHSTKEGYIAIYSSCISPAKCHKAPLLAPIPDALAKCSNVLSHLTGAFGLSKNICALQIYSGTLGTILDSTPNVNWFYPSLLHAAN